MNSMAAAGLSAFYEWEPVFRLSHNILLKNFPFFKIFLPFNPLNYKPFTHYFVCLTKYFYGII